MCRSICVRRIEMATVLKLGRPNKYETEADITRRRNHQVFSLFFATNDSRPNSKHASETHLMYTGVTKPQ